MPSGTVIGKALTIMFMALPPVPNPLRFTPTVCICEASE